MSEEPIRYATCLDDGRQIVSGAIYEFTILGHVVPYVRMTRRGKFTSRRAQAYMAWQEDARWQLREQMVASGWTMIPDRVPFVVRMWFTPYQHRGDLDNLVKAVLDAAQVVVFPNDSYCDEIVAARATGGTEGARLIVRWPA
jgi:Holliday junction resolvase RusA-like endonuclease